MRAQVLADFVYDLSPNIDDQELSTKKGEWTLSIDRSGVGIIVEEPGGVIVEHSVRFGFKESNNQGEYEALLAGIRLAKELGATRLMIKRNSQLIIGQVNGEYQARDL
ncbi:hypothetical protein CR513_51033, partial [Mucuna pruriens]